MDELKKEFTKKEMYDYLQYFMYCQCFDIDNIKDCATFKMYQEFLKDAETHHGDCTKEPVSCLRCQLYAIEIKAQNILDILWSDPKGHCGKICIKECEGSKSNK